MSKKIFINDDIMICINGPESGKILKKADIQENSGNEIMPLNVFVSNFKEIYKVSEIIEKL